MNSDLKSDSNTDFKADPAEWMDGTPYGTPSKSYFPILESYDSFNNNEYNFTYSNNNFTHNEYNNNEFKKEPARKEVLNEVTNKAELKANEAVAEEKSFITKETVHVVDDAGADFAELEKQD